WVHEATAFVAAASQVILLMLVLSSTISSVLVGAPQTFLEPIDVQVQLAGWTNPYLFSLALRTNPFDEKASVIVS
ncbi:MAG: hypothetical protein HGA55_02035, partial [Methanoregulaceae archaeon]|nr:hypothetical protein [Methanoregulaceae archaeon]